MEGPLIRDQVFKQQSGQQVGGLLFAIIEHAGIPARAEVPKPPKDQVHHLVE